MRGEQKADAGLDGGKFLTQGFTLAFELATRPLSLGARFDRCCQAFLKSLSARRLHFEAVIELCDRLAQGGALILARCVCLNGIQESA
jgi:hypothetical protein